MKKSLIFILIFSFFSSFSQLEGQGIASINHTLNSNPAVTGNQNALSATLSFRNEWLSDEYHPRILALSMHTPLKNQKWNVGMMLYNDRFGLQNQNALWGYSSYKIQMSKGILSTGVKAGLNSLSYQEGDFILQDAGDIVFEPNANFLTLSLGLGVYYETQKWYLGASLPDISRHTSDNFMAYGNTNYWNYRFMGAYFFDIKEGLEFKNHFFIKGMGSIKPILEYIPMIVYKKKIETALILRTNVNFGFLANYIISPKLKGGYIFDFNGVSGLPKSVGNHEIVISYRLAEIVNTDNPKFFQ
ncbi:MAG: hypothetical protein RLZZ546_1110 [Bacteroidota bacterium]|jgi:type IX secretion system PorP/SprF family membrane protein